MSLDFFSNSSFTIYIQSKLPFVHIQSNFQYFYMHIAFYSMNFPGHEWEVHLSYSPFLHALLQVVMRIQGVGVEDEFEMGQFHFTFT